MILLNDKYSQGGTTPCEIFEQEYSKNIHMTNQLQTHSQEKNIASFDQQFPEFSENNREYSQEIIMYRSKIQQLETEQLNLSRQIAECYDYIELQEHMAKKHHAKIRKLQRALRSNGSPLLKMEIPAGSLEWFISIALTIYALYIMFF